MSANLHKLIFSQWCYSGYDNDSTYSFRRRMVLHPGTLVHVLNMTSKNIGTVPSVFKHYTVQMIDLKTCEIVFFETYDLGAALELVS